MERKSRDELKEEHENAGFRLVRTGYSLQKKLEDALDKGNYDEYFMVCKKTGVSPNEEIVEMFPQKYSMYFGDYKAVNGNNYSENSSVAGDLRNLARDSHLKNIVERCNQKIAKNN